MKTNFKYLQQKVVVVEEARFINSNWTSDLIIKVLHRRVREVTLLGNISVPFLKG